MKKIIIFDIWGEFGHFKKPYTTTSPLTFSIPSRTALTGVIGAILGIEKNKNNDALNYSKCNLAVRIVNPIKKIMVSQNLIDTKTSKMMARMKPKGGRTQIRFEKLKDPRYRVYAEIFDNGLHSQLKESLKEHISIYTPCMGLSEDIANFEYIGEYGYTTKTECAGIQSVIPLDAIDPSSIEFSEGGEYFSDNFPMEMDGNRVVTRYREILLERRGKEIKVNNCEFVELENNERIIWY